MSKLPDSSNAAVGCLPRDTALRDCRTNNAGRIDPSRLFRPFRQMGVMVRDIDRAMRHWPVVCGIGPWFFAEYGVPVVEMAQTTPECMSIFDQVQKARSTGVAAM